MTRARRSFTPDEVRDLVDRAAHCLSDVLGEDDDFWRERFEHWRRYHQEQRDAMNEGMNGRRPTDASDPAAPDAATLRVVDLNEHGAVNARL